MIRYANILRESVVDGKGIRLVVFLQGCTIDCEGCHNPAIQDMSGGIEVTEEEFAQVILNQINPLHRGITISGGEPSLQADAVHKVLRIVKEAKPQLDIWLYSGYTFEKIKTLAMLELVDVLVDGPFILNEKSLDLPFRGSKNQRIIDVKQSLAQGQVVEYSPI